MPQDQQNMKAEDLYDLPDDAGHYELVAGCLISEPLNGAQHGRILAKVGAFIYGYLEEHPIGIVLGGDSGFLLARSPDTVRGPDVAFVTRERYEAAGDSVRIFPGAPDLAIEVRSPSDRTPDIRSKVADYLAAGSRLVWVVDPAVRTVTIYGPSPTTLHSPQVLGPNDTLEGGDVLPGFTVQVQRIFQLP